MSKHIENLKNPMTLAYIGCCAAAALIYGLFRAPFFLHFVDGLSVAGVVMFVIGIVRLWWKDGHFVGFGWNPKKEKYDARRRTKIKERSEYVNSSLYAAAVVIPAALILTVIYMMTVS